MSEPTQSYHGKTELLPPLNPEQIADYIHEEHTPYSEMDLEHSKRHLAELIQRYANYEVQKYKVSIELP